MKILQSISLPHRAGVIVAILAAVVAAALIVSVALTQSHGAGAQTSTPSTSTQITNADFPSGDTDTDITIEAGQTRIISGALDAGAGDDGITNEGTLIIGSGSSIAGLEGFTQSSAAATLRIEIAADPENDPVLNFLGAVTALIEDGKIEIDYTGEWRPTAGEPFTLLAVSIDQGGNADVTDPVQITDIDDTGFEYTYVRGAASGLEFIEVTATLPDPSVDNTLITDADFPSGDTDTTIIIPAGETRIISGAVDAGGTGFSDTIENQGTLIVEAGASIANLGRFAQTSAAATLIIEIADDPGNNPVVAPWAQSSIVFGEEGGAPTEIQIDYTGDWRPNDEGTFALFTVSPAQLGGTIILDALRVTDDGSTEFGYTTTLAGSQADFRLIITANLSDPVVPPDPVDPPDPPPVDIISANFTPNSDNLIIGAGEARIIDGNINAGGGNDDQITNNGTLIIVQGSSITNLENIEQTSGNAILRFQIARDPGNGVLDTNLAIVSITNGRIELDYTGDWRPDDGETFALLTSTSEDGDLRVGSSVQITDDGTTDFEYTFERCFCDDTNLDRLSIQVTANLPRIATSDFPSGDMDTDITIQAGETFVISDADTVEAGDGTDTITNEGTLIIRQGASFTGLETFTQSAADAILRIEIADDPEDNPLIDFGGADLSITGGEIQINYTGDWRPDADEIFTPATSASANVTYALSVPIIDINEGAGFGYIGTVDIGPLSSTFDIQVHPVLSWRFDNDGDRTFGESELSGVINLTLRPPVDTVVDFTWSVTPGSEDGVVQSASRGPTNRVIAANVGDLTAVVMLTNDNLVDAIERFDVVVDSVTRRDGGVVTFDNSGGIGLSVTDDDDSVASIRPAATVAEGMTITFTVDLDLLVNEDFQLAWEATNGTGTNAATVADDLNIQSGRVNIPNGTFQIQTSADDVVEADEVFSVTLSSTILGIDFVDPSSITVHATNRTAIGTITDTDTAEVSLRPTAPPAEEGEEIAFTVELDNPVAETFSLGWTAGNGTATVDDDLDEQSGTVEIPANSREVTFTIPITNDDATEGIETFTVELTGAPTGLVDIAPSRLTVDRSTATGTINASDLSLLTDDDFTSGADTITIDAGETRTISGALNAGNGSDTIENNGTLIVKAGSSITNLEQLTQASAATLRIEIADNPGSNPVLDPLAQSAIVLGEEGGTPTEIQIDYTGDWRPNGGGTFALFSVSAGTITIHSLQVTDNGNPDYFEYTADAVGSQLVVTANFPDSSLTNSDFSGNAAVTIQAGQTRIISGDLNAGAGNDTITNNGTLIIRQGAGITGLERIIQPAEATDAILRIEIAEDPSGSVVVFRGLTLNVQGGELQIYYTGSWRPDDDETFRLLTTDGSGATSITIASSVPITDNVGFGYTRVGGGGFIFDYRASASPITTSDFPSGDEDTDITIGARIISGTVDAGDGDDTITNEGTLIIRQGASFTGLENFTQSSASAILRIEIADDPADNPTDPLIDFGGAELSITGGEIQINYTGSWRPDADETFISATSTNPITYSLLVPIIDVNAGFGHTGTVDTADDDSSSSLNIQVHPVLSWQIPQVDPTFFEDEASGMGSISLFERPPVDTQIDFEWEIRQFNTEGFEPSVSTTAPSSSIGADVSSAPLQIMLTDDEIVDGVELIDVVVTSATRADGGIVTFDNSGGRVSIRDRDDTTTVSVSAPGPVTEGGIITFAVELTSQVAEEFQLTWQATNFMGDDAAATVADDLNTQRGTVTIPEGSSSVPFGVRTSADDLVEADDEIFLVRLSGNILGLDYVPRSKIDVSSAPATGTISDEDTAEVSLIRNAPTAEEGENITFTVELDNPVAETFSLGWTASNGTTTDSDLGEQSGTVEIPANSLIATFTIPITNDDATEDSETFTVELTGAPTGLVDITPNRLTINRSFATGTINASDIPLLTDSDFTSGAVDTTITIPAGETRIISGALDAGDGSDRIINEGTLVLRPGASVTNLDDFIQTGATGTLRIEIADDPDNNLNNFVISSWALSTAFGGNSEIQIAYVGDWRPDDGEEFTLFDTDTIDNGGSIDITSNGPLRITDTDDDTHFQYSATAAAVANRPRLNIQADLVFITSSDFTSGDDTITIQAGETRIISGALDAGNGTDNIVNKGVLVLSPGASITNLTGFTQTGEAATLTIEIADDQDPSTDSNGEPIPVLGRIPILDLGEADISISDGGIQIRYTGTWKPNAFDTFTLFATKGNIAIPSSVLITDNIGNTNPGYIGTRYGTVTDRYNVQVQRYTLDDILTPADFTAARDALVIEAGETRVISGELTITAGSLLTNHGTLIIKQGATITGLGIINGFIHSGANARLIFDIDLDDAPEGNIFRLMGPFNNSTFFVSGGKLHFNYLGAWLPTVVPDTNYTLINGFDIFGATTTTQSAFGNPTDGNSGFTSTVLRAVIPQEGAVIGGPDATIPTVFPNGDSVFTNQPNFITLNSGTGPLRIAGNLNFRGGAGNGIFGDGGSSLTIDEGVTIEGLGFTNGGLQRGGLNTSFTINMTRDDPSDDPVIRLPGARFLDQAEDPIYVNYGGDWEPSIFGDEFTLIEARRIDVGLGRESSHSQDSTNISVSSFFINSSLELFIATVTPRAINDAIFVDPAGTFTIQGDEGRAIDGTVDFADNPTIQNNGGLLIRAGATIQNLELLSQTETATLRIEIAEDPGTDPVLDLGDADVNITQGTIELAYTGTWRPDTPEDVFTLFATTGDITIEPSVQIIDIDTNEVDEFRDTQYTGDVGVDGDGNNIFNVEATGPTVIESAELTNDHFTDGDDTIILASTPGTTLASTIQTDLDAGDGNDTIENRGFTQLAAGISIDNLEAFIQTTPNSTVSVIVGDVSLPAVGDDALFDLGSADITITDGRVALTKGESEVALFATRGDVDISPPSEFVDSFSGRSYNVTPFGTVPEVVNLRLQSYNFIDDRVTIDDFEADVLTITAGTARVIDGDLVLGGAGKIINNGTLVIRSGASITGLAEVDGYVQSSDTATLAFEIDLDAPPTVDIVTFTTTTAATTATNDTFNITGGGARFDYVGDWQPSSVPDQVITLFNSFDIFNAGADLEFQHSVYGRISEVTRSDTATEFRVLLPQGAVIGGDDATFAPVIPDPDSGADSIVIEPGGSLRIAGDLTVSGITNRADLTIEEGATITITDAGSLQQASAAAALTFELSRDQEQPLAQAVFSLVDGQFQMTGGTLRIEYGGGWEPSPDGDEFTLIDGLDPMGSHTLPDPDNVSHPLRFSDISLRLSADNTSIIATTTVWELDSEFFSGDSDRITITADESVTINGTLNAGGSTDTITNEGDIFIRAGATFTSLENFVQTAEDAVLRIEIAGEPGDDPVLRFGTSFVGTRINITGGEIQLVYTGEWRPDEGEIFDLLATRASSSITIGDAVEITDNGDPDYFQYALTRREFDGDIIISVQADSPPDRVINSTAFDADSNTLTVARLTVSEINADLDTGDGFDTIANQGTLIVRAGISISNLEILAQSSSEAVVLRIEIAEDPGNNPILDLGSADIIIPDGEIQLRYTGDWRPDPRESFTLFATKGTIDISSSVQITDNAVIPAETGIQNTGTRFGTVTDRYNVQVQRYTLDDVITAADFDADNILTIDANTTRVISGALDFGGTGRINNLGTLIIKSGSTITGLAPIDGFTQTANTNPSLVFDIDLDAPTTGDIVTFTTTSAAATNDTFEVTRGSVHFNYLGDWVPAPFQRLTLFSNFDLFGDGGNVTVTHSAYGNVDRDSVNASTTDVRFLIPREGAVIGGDDPTFTPIFTNAFDELLVPPNHELRIAGDIALNGNPVIIDGTLTIDEGVTISGLGTGPTLGVTSSATDPAPQLILNLTRNEAPTTALVTFDGGNVTFRDGSRARFGVNYRGDWQPTPLGDEFTLIDGLDASASHLLPVLGEDVFHSAGTSTLALRLSDDNTSIIGTTTLVVMLGDSDFDDNADTITISESEGSIISGAVDFGGGTDSITSAGALLVRAGASFVNLENFSQTVTGTLKIEIADPPGNEPVLDFGDATVDIDGEIQIAYTGSWRPIDDQIFTLLATTTAGVLTVAPSVQIINADDAANFRYAAVQTDSNNIFNVQAEVPPPPLELELANDTGISDEDNITNANPLTFNGSRAVMTTAMVTVTATPADGASITIMTLPESDETFSADLALGEGVWEITSTQSEDGVVVTSSPAFNVTVDRTAPTFDVQPAWITTALVFADGFIRLDIPEIAAGVVDIDDIFTPAVTDDTEATIAYGKRNRSPVGSPSNDCGDYTYNLGSTLEYAEILQRDVVLVTAQEVRVCARAADAAGNFRISDPTGLLTLTNVPNPSSVGLIPEHDAGPSNSDGNTNRANTLPFDFFVRGNFLSGAVVSVELEKNDVIAGTYYTLVTENTNEVIVTVLPGVIERNGDLTVIGRHTVGGTLSADGRTLTGGISDRRIRSPQFGLSVSRGRPGSFSRSPSFRVQTIGADAHASLGIRDVFNDASNSAANTDGIDIIYGTRTSGLSAGGDCANLNSYTYNLGTEVEYHEINYIGQIVVCAMVTNFHGNVRGSLQTGILTVEEPTNPAPTPVISFSELHDTGTLGDGITSRAVSQGFDFDLTGPFATGAIVTLIINPPGGGRDEFLVDFTASALVSGMVVTVPGSDFAANEAYTIRARQSDGGVPSHISDPITLTIDRTTPTFTTQPEWISTADVFSDGDGLMISPAEHAQLLLSSSPIQDIFTHAVSDDPDGATITYAKKTADIGAADPDANCSEYDYEDPVLGLGTSVEYSEISVRGKVRVCARVADAAGNTTYSNATAVLTADTEILAPTSISLIADHDTGSDDSDGITNYAGAFTFDVVGGFSTGTRIDITVTNPSNVETLVEGTILAESTTTARVTVSDATLFAADGNYTLTALQMVGAISSESTPELTITVDRTAPNFTTQPAWITTPPGGVLVINAQQLLVTGVNIGDIFTPAVINDPGATIAYGKRTSTTSTTPSTNCAADYDYNLGATLELSQIEEEGTTIVCASATDTAGNIAYSNPTAVLEIDLLLSGLTYGSSDDTLTIPADATRIISGAINFGSGSDTLENNGDLLIRADAAITGLEAFRQTSASAILRIEIAGDPNDDPVLDFGAANITIEDGTVHIYYTGTWRAAEGSTFTLFTTTGTVTFGDAVQITDNDTDTDFDFIPTQSGTDPVDLDLEAVQMPDMVIDDSSFTGGDDIIVIDARGRSVISGAVDAQSGNDSITNAGSLRLGAGAGITGLETFTQTDVNALLRIDIGTAPGNNPVFDFGDSAVTISDGQILINYTGDWRPTDGDTIILFSTTSTTFAVSTSILVTDSDDATEFAYISTQSGNNYTVLALLPPTTSTTIPDQRIIQGESVDIDIDTGNFFASGGTLTYSATAANGTIATVNVAGDTLTITGTAAGTTDITVTATGEVGRTVTQTFSLAVAPPKLAAPTLDETSSDSGTVGDGITNDTTPTFTGNDAQPNASVTITGRNVESITGEGTYPLGELVDAMLYPLTEDNIRVTSVSVALGTSTAGTGNNDIHIRTEHLFGESVESDNVVVDGVSGGNSRPNRTDIIVLHDTDDGTFTATATLADGTSQTIRIYTINTLEDTEGPSAMVVGAVRLLDGTAEATATANSSGEYSGDLPELSAQGLWEVTAVQIASGLTSITSPITSINLDSIPPAHPPNFGIANRSIAAGDTNVITSVAPSFSNENGLSYSAASSNEAAATVSLVGSRLTVRAVATGTANITVTATDIAGNQNQLTFRVEVLPPTLAAPSLASESDSGTSDNDGITGDETPTFTGSDAEAGAMVTVTAALISGGVRTTTVARGTDTADANGDYSAALSTLSAQGLWEVTAVQIASGLTSITSPITSITFDSNAPDLDTNFPIADRSIAAGGTNVITSVAPSFSNENGLTYSAASDNEAAATVSLVGSRLTISAVATGTATITVTATDIAGNQSDLAFVVTVFALVAPTNLELTDGSNSGATNDNVTNSQNILFDARATGGRTVRFTASPDSGPDVTITRVATSDGTIVGAQFTNLAEGEWTITAVEIADGAMSEPTAALVITIDRTAPATQGAISGRTAIMGGSDTTLPNVAQYFDPDDPDRNNFVFTVGSSDEAVATATLNAQNNSITIEVVGVGTAEITLTATDTAGNVSAEQKFNFVVIARGAGLDQPDLDERDDTGEFTDDDVTNKTSLRISGTGPANTDITILAEETIGMTRAVTLDVTLDTDGAYTATLDLMVQGIWAIAATTQSVTTVAGLPALMVTIDTTPPAPQGSVDTQTLGFNASTVIEGISGLFTDATQLAYEVATADSNVVTVSLTVGNDLRITGSGIGRTTISITAEDLAGNRSTAQTFEVIVVPPALPKPTLANDTGSDDTDGITMDTEVTIGGTGASTVAGASVTVTARASSDIRTSTVLVGPSGAYTAETLSFYSGVWEVIAIQTVAGLTSAASTVLTVTVDTAPPGVQTTIQNQDFFGYDPVTISDITQYFVTEAGDEFEYSADVTSTTITVTLDGSSNDLTITTDGTAATANAAIIATDTAGNETRQLFVITFHPPALTSPILDTADDLGSSSNDRITSKTSLTFTGSGAEAGAEVVVTAVDAAAVHESVQTSVIPEAGGAYSATLNLAFDGVWEIVAAQVVAGLTSAASTALTVTIDITPPATTGAVQTPRRLDGIGDTITLLDITQYFAPEAGEALTYSATVARNIATLVGNDLTITSATAGTATAAVTATDTAGNVAFQNFNIDVYPLRLNAPELNRDDDLGSSNIDGITSKTSLRFVGTDAQPEITVMVTATPTTTTAAIQSGMATANASGEYTVTLELSDGGWEVTATQIAAGIPQPLTSPVSELVAITVDTMGPGEVGEIPATHTLDLGTDPIQIIADVTRFFSSTPGDTIRYIVDIISRSSTANQTAASLDSNNNLNVTPGNTVGRVVLEITATDDAGNEATQTVTVSVRLGLPDLASDGDTGSSDSDNITNQTTGLRISGTGAVPNVDVRVTRTGSNTTTTSTRANGSGEYSTTINLSRGTWRVTVTQELGNPAFALPDSPALTVIVDDTPPTISGVTLTNNDGTYPNFANENDVLTLAFTVDEALATMPTVTFGGQPADVSKVGLTYTATRTVTGDETQGDVIYVIANVADIAGNTTAVMTVTSPTIDIDTEAPEFQRNRPAPSTETGRVIGDNERDATNIINVGNTDANDLIAFAVRTTTATCDADFGTFTTAAQFDAANLIAEGDNFICVRLTDRAGNAPSVVFASTSIVRNFVSPRPSGDIPPRTLTTGELVTFDDAYFVDENDTLEITARSSNPAVVEVVPSNDDDSFILRAVAVFPDGGDTVTITVTATDTAGQTARQMFEVTVTSEFDIEFPEPPSGSDIEHFVVVEVDEDSPDRPTPPRGVRFPVAVYDITPQDSAGNDLEDVTAEVCLSVEGLIRLGNLAVYHFNDGAWERLPSYISDDGTHICAETQSFSIFALGFVVEEAATRGLLPPTGGITPNIWIITAAATAGSMTLIAGAALALTTLSRRLTRKSSPQEQQPIT